MREEEKKEIPEKLYNALLEIEKYCSNNDTCENCVRNGACPLHRTQPEFWDVEANYKPTPTEAEAEPTEEPPTAPAINVYFNIDKINISFPTNCCDTRQEELKRG